MPSKVIFTITIDTSFKAVCYNHSKLTSVQHLFSVAAKVWTYSQLNDIFGYMKKQPPDLNAELFSCSSFLAVIVNLELAASERITKCTFLCDQTEFNAYEKLGPHIVREATNLYLRSRNAYKTWRRNLLILLHKETIKNYFGELGSTGSLQECSTVIRNVFENLQEI